LGGAHEQRTKARNRMLKINQEKGILVEIFDTETGVTKIYNSIREAANAIGCSHVTILRAEKVFLEKGYNKLIKEKYTISRRRRRR